jgi:hypothetical protein
MNSPLLTINRATIEVTETVTQIHATVNGTFCECWCIYAGNTNSHIAAAWDYLTETVGLSYSDIHFEDETQNDDLFIAEGCYWVNFFQDAS